LCHLKGQRHEIIIAVLLNSADLILPPDISLTFLKSPFNILFMFTILMHGTQIVIEFHLSFQKMRKRHLIDSFSLLAEFFRKFVCPFYY